MLDPMPRRDVTMPPTKREAELIAEIERLRDRLQKIEMLTATGDGLDPDQTIEVHLLAETGRDFPAPVRAVGETDEVDF